jgi:hypothetical protein
LPIPYKFFSENPRENKLYTYRIRVVEFSQNPAAQKLFPKFLSDIKRCRCVSHAERCKVLLIHASTTRLLLDWFSSAALVGGVVGSFHYGRVVGLVVVLESRQRWFDAGLGDRIERWIERNPPDRVRRSGAGKNSLLRPLRRGKGRNEASADELAPSLTNFFQNFWALRS